MTVKQQSVLFLKQLANRKRGSLKPGTLNTYESFMRTWILPELGELEVGEVENDSLRELVQKMADKGLSASTMTGVTNCIKALVGSVMDKKGNELYPRTWNNDFIDLPVIVPREQKTPVLGAQEVTGAILNAPSTYQTLFLILAASGLRINEALALKARSDPQSSYFDPNRRMLVIQKGLYRGQEQSTKTAAGVREIDLYPALSDRLNSVCADKGYILTGDDRPLRLQSCYDVAERMGIPGFHSFRRFRVRHLENMNVPPGLIQFWTGHAGKSVTDRYVKFGQDIEARKQWAEKAGLGFEL